MTKHIDRDLEAQGIDAIRHSNQLLKQAGEASDQGRYEEADELIEQAQKETDRGGRLFEQSRGE